MQATGSKKERSGARSHLKRWEYPRRLLSMETNSELEKDLPDWLTEPIRKMEGEWAKIDAGGGDDCWDVAFGMLQTEINIAETEHIIAPSTATYLRRKYLRYEE